MKSKMIALSFPHNLWYCLAIIFNMLVTCWQSVGLSFVHKNVFVHVCALLLSSPPAGFYRRNDDVVTWVGEGHLIWKHGCPIVRRSQDLLVGRMHLYQHIWFCLCFFGVQ